jgi:hypothetical protein
MFALGSGLETTARLRELRDRAGAAARDLSAALDARAPTGLPVLLEHGRAAVLAELAEVTDLTDTSRGPSTYRRVVATLLGARNGLRLKQGYEVLDRVIGTLESRNTLPRTLEGECSLYATDLAAITAHATEILRTAPATVAISSIYEALHIERLLGVACSGWSPEARRSSYEGLLERVLSDPATDTQLEAWRDRGADFPQYLIREAVTISPDRLRLIRLLGELVGRIPSARRDALGVALDRMKNLPTNSGDRMTSPAAVVMASEPGSTAKTLADAFLDWLPSHGSERLGLDLRYDDESARRLLLETTGRRLPDLKRSLSFLAHPTRMFSGAGSPVDLARLANWAREEREAVAAAAARIADGLDSLGDDPPPHLLAARVLVHAVSGRPQPPGVLEALVRGMESTGDPRDLTPILDAVVQIWNDRGSAREILGSKAGDCEDSVELLARSNEQAARLLTHAKPSRRDAVLRLTVAIEYMVEDHCPGTRPALRAGALLTCLTLGTGYPSEIRDFEILRQLRDRMAVADPNSPDARAFVELATRRLAREATEPASPSSPGSSGRTATGSPPPRGR